MQSSGWLLLLLTTTHVIAVDKWIMRLGRDWMIDISTHIWDNAAYYHTYFQIVSVFTAILEFNNLWLFFVGL